MSKVRAYLTALGMPEDIPINPLIPESVLDGPCGRLPAIDMPPALAALPVYQGFPVGFMFSENKGVPDFKTIDPRKVAACVRHDLCGLCGTRLGIVVTTVGGIVTAQQRTSTDPPFHYECARYACGVCPFILGRSGYSKQTQEEMADVKMAGFTLLDKTTKMALLTSFVCNWETVPNHPEYRVFQFGAWLQAEWFDRGGP